jgi:glutaredoxin
MRLLLGCLVLAGAGAVTGAASAQTLYRSVGPDGRPVYSDKPPVLYAAAWCGYCRQARAYLARAGIPYEDVDIDTPAGKAAFVAAGGGGGVPLLIVKGQPLRGYSELAYDQAFAGHK